MNISFIKRLIALTLLSTLLFALLASCSSNKLTGNFNEEEIENKAENVILILNEQNSEGLIELCNVQMRQVLTDDVIKQTFESIGEGGQFIEVEDMSISGTKDKFSGEEFAVVIAKAKYEIKTFIFTITFTRQMKLAGLYYK